MSRPTFFLHVPKTAGTSIGEMFRARYGPEAVFQFERPAFIDEARAERLRSHKLVFGHLPLRTIPGIDAGWFRFTMVRDPVDRFISNYYYMRGQATVARNEARHATLEEFVEHFADERIGNVVNGTASFFVDLTRLPTARDGEILAQAKEGLAGFDLVGIQEEFEASMHLLCGMNGLPTFPEMKRVNVTDGRKGLDELTPSLRRRIEELNALDGEFYRWAWDLHRQARNRVLWSFVSSEPAAASLPEPDAPRRAPRRPAPFETGEIRVISLGMARDGREMYEFQSGDLVELFVLIESDVDRDDVSVGFHIDNVFSECLFGTNSTMMGRPLAVRAGGKYAVEYRWPLNLGEGDYTVGVAIHTKESHLEHCFVWRDEALRFCVLPPARQTFLGTCRLEPTLAFADRVALLDDMLDGSATLSLRTHRPPRALAPGEECLVFVALANGTRYTWGLPSQGLVLSYHWLRPSGEVVEFDGLRSPIPAPVVPGQEMMIPVSVKAPEETGPHTLRITLVQEGISWLDERQPPIRADVDVEVDGAGAARTPDHAFELFRSRD